VRFEASLRSLASLQLGHASRAQALDLGLSSTEIGRLVSRGSWTMVSDRVLRINGLPASAGEQLIAAVLDEGAGAVASHTSAAWLWGLGGFSAGEVVLTRVGSRDRRTQLGRVHQVRSLPDRWVTVHEGIPVVRPELMVMQLCAVLSKGRAERALDNAWRERLLSGMSLRRFLDDHAARGRNGIALLREFTDSRGDQYAPPGSNLESRVKALFADTPVLFESQVDVGAEAWTGRVDFYERSVSLVLEVQSEKYHSSLLDAEQDRRRIRSLVEAGFVVIETTDDEVFTSPQALVSRVLAQYWQLRRAIS